MFFFSNNQILIISLHFPEFQLVRTKCFSVQVFHSKRFLFAFQFLNCRRLLDIYRSPDEIVYNGFPNNKTKIQLYFIFVTHPQLFPI